MLSSSELCFNSGITSLKINKASQSVTTKNTVGPSLTSMIKSLTQRREATKVMQQWARVHTPADPQYCCAVRTSSPVPWGPLYCLCSSPLNVHILRVLLLPRMDRVKSAPCLLLALPDACLQAVMQCCAGDQRSLFSAARAHSRLHQAVAALRSVTAVMRYQQHVDDVLLYLGKHGQHVNTLDFKSNQELEDDHVITVSLRQLPFQSQFSSLQLGCLCLQLQPRDGWQGILGPSRAAAVAALKQLRFENCMLLDDTSDEQLTAALSLLPAGLEHLSIDGFYTKTRFPTAVLQQLQQLTYLGLHFVHIVPPSDSSNPLQPMQALTRLRDLRLQPEQLENGDEPQVTASMFSGMQHLTRVVFWKVAFEPGILAGKSMLQHLAAWDCSVIGVAATFDAPPDSTPGITQLLSHLQQLTQLTYLDLSHTLGPPSIGLQCPMPSVAAYSSLTASSKLQHLAAAPCELPQGVWQQVFPTSRQLQHLQSLEISSLRQPYGGTAPEGDRLVSCCPGLQSLAMMGVVHGAGLLPALQQLSGLYTLSLTLTDLTAAAGLQAVCQLTGLRKLKLQAAGGSCWDRDTEGWLLQLSQLQQLTALTYEGPIMGLYREVTFTVGVS